MTNAAPQQTPRPIPKFTNAAKLIADPCPDHLQIVSVQPSAIMGPNNTPRHVPVANVTNTHALLRRAVEGMADGAYTVNTDGSLSPTVYQDGLQYPYIEHIKPRYLTRYDETGDVSKLPILCSLDNQIMSSLIRLCDDVARVDGDLIMGRAGIVCQQNENMLIQYPFGANHQIRLHPRYLRIILVEMLLHTEVKMLRPEPDLAHYALNEEPLFIGKGWWSCGVIMPKPQPRG